MEDFHLNMICDMTMLSLTVTLRAGTPVPKASKMHFSGTSQPWMPKMFQGTPSEIELHSHKLQTIWTLQITYQSIRLQNSNNSHLALLMKHQQLDQDEDCSWLFVVVLLLRSHWFWKGMFALKIQYLHRRQIA